MIVTVICTALIIVSVFSVYTSINYKLREILRILGIINEYLNVSSCLYDSDNFHTTEDAE